MEIIEALDWLEGRLRFNIRPGLQRIIRLLELLGNPEQKLNLIHLAGTNGKGSTLAFTRSIFMQKQMQVGSFSSPFITSFNEQFAINGQSISDEKLLALIKKIKPLVEQMDKDEEVAGVTEFEIKTALAFEYFYQEKVDLALIEVGLGGLLDSTNVIRPKLSVITTVGLDHVDILGDSLSEIAYQKAGIIKENIPVIVGNLLPEALEVVEEYASEQKAQTFIYNKDFFLSNQSDFQDEDLTITDLQPSLAGQHQFENAALAIKIALEYGKLEELFFSQAEFKTALSNTFWPARMEKLSDQPLTILDGAHNPHAIKRLVENLNNDFAGQKKTILFTAITTKNICKMIKMLQNVKNANLILTTFEDSRALDLAEFKDLEGEGVELAANWQEKLDQLTSNKTEEMLIITGSLYFSAQVRKRYFP